MTQWIMVDGILESEASVPTISSQIPLPSVFGSPFSFLRALGKGPRRAQCPDVLMDLSKDGKGLACCRGRPSCQPPRRLQAGSERLWAALGVHAISKMIHQALTINAQTRSHIRTCPVDLASQEEPENLSYGRPSGHSRSWLSAGEPKDHSSCPQAHSAEP